MSWSVRPLLVLFERYSTEQQRRHDVLPGLTDGLSKWSTRQRDERFEHDIAYVDNRTLLRDVGTLFRIRRRC